MIMTTSELISAIASFQAVGKFRTRPDRTVTELLHLYFTQSLANGLAEDNKYVSVLQQITDYLDDAWNMFLYSKDSKVMKLRERYEADTNRPVPDLVHVGRSNVVDRVVQITGLGYLMKEITGEEWFGEKIESYFFAEDRVLEHAFRRFLRSVYHDGMFDVIEKSNKCGMSGVFGGSTTLRTYCMIGRIMITFAREKSDSQENFTFVGGEHDKPAVSFGIQSVFADLTTCLSMIDDVVAGWAIRTKKGRSQVFTEDEKVCIG